MKKAFIGFVLCAWATCVLAQERSSSPVTLYGKLDLGYAVTNGGEFEKRYGRDGKFQQWGNGRYYSRWGIRGSEAIGNDVKVFFKLESLINPENGEHTSGKIFDRGAYVGASGRLGLLQAGRQETLIFTTLRGFDASGGPNTGASLGNTKLTSTQRFGGSRPRAMTRLDSALMYASPNWKGLQVKGLVALKNDNLNKNIFSLALLYQQGNLSLGTAYETAPEAGMSASWGAGIKYDFGSFILAGGYFDNHQKIDGKGVYLGFKVPIRAFSFGVQVSYNFDGRTLETGDEKLKPFAFALFGTYNLSKRTSLYAQAAYINKDAKVFIKALRQGSASMGIVHDF